MTVTFSVRGDRSDNFLNVANMNARDLLEVLGFEGGSRLYGELRGAELRARIQAARRKPDVGKPDERVCGRITILGREPGRMTEYLDVLEQLCDTAGDLGLIVWG